MEKKNTKTNGNWKRKTLIVLCAVLALILIMLIAVTFYVETLLNQIDRNPDNETLSSSALEDLLNDETGGTGPTVDEDDIDFGDSDSIIKGEHIYNILLIGQDRREGQGRQRSDAMILCTVNTKTKTLTMTSFLRDVYVQIPGYKNNKINACYAIGGMELLDATLEKNFGIQVDANIEVDFSGFMDIVDMMGGVEIELTSAEANYLNKNGNWDVIENEHWSLKEGKNLLNGSQALAYSRIRYIGTDFGRTDRQRKVLTALVDKIKDLNLLELNELVFEAAELITTDMTNSEITGYIAKFAPMLTDLKIVNQRVPADNTYHFGDVGSIGDCIIIDFEANRALLEQALTD